MAKGPEDFGYVIDGEYFSAYDLSNVASFDDVAKLIGQEKADKLKAAGYEPWDAGDFFCDEQVDPEAEAIKAADDPHRRDDPRFIWVCESGNWLIQAPTRELAYFRVIENRMAAGQTEEEATAWFNKDDQLLEIDGEL